MGLLRALWVGSRSATAAFLAELQDEFFPAVDPFSRRCEGRGEEEDDVLTVFKPAQPSDRLARLKENLADLGMSYRDNVIYDENLVAARAAYARTRAALSRSEYRWAVLANRVEAFLRAHDQLSLYKRALAVSDAAPSENAAEQHVGVVRLTEAQKRVADRLSDAIDEMRLAVNELCPPAEAPTPAA
jgi:hypothetical protein